MHIFFSVGEPSGDQHGAELIHELQRLQPGLRCSGFGGPEMEAAGLQSLFRLTDLAVMGVSQVLPLLNQFTKLVKQARAFLAEERPSAVVLIDFPGFNWWIARAAKAEGIPVYYYCPPQLWAWAPWRIRKVRRLVDCVLSVLPFEAKWYRQRGVAVEYVGHPFFDEVAAHPFQPEQLKEFQTAGLRTIGILPGSRKQEVLRNFPVMLDVMQELYEKHPLIRFDIACYKEWHLAECTSQLQARGVHLPVHLHVGQTPAVIEAADFCLMVSGSVSLELLARKTPAAVLYRGTWLTYVLAKTLITVKYFSLPNLIAGRELMPEFPLVRRRSHQVDRMFTTLDAWLTHPEQLAERQQELSQLADEIVEVGGVRRAAEVLLVRLAREQRGELSADTAEPVNLQSEWSGPTPKSTRAA